jgi:prolyl-tRNA editing enzyme YbaK/EbsC (Cys-tRNA(Pro) deacylase)
LSCSCTATSRSARSRSRALGRKTIRISAPEVATKHSGYLVDGRSPFGTRKPMPVCMERTILDLPRIYVNGGHRGSS